MVWETWLAQVAPIIGTTATQAGVVLSLLFSIAFILFVVIGSPKNAHIGMPLIGLFSMFFFTYIAWLPIWTGTALAFVVSIWLGLVIKGELES